MNSDYRQNAPDQNFLRAFTRRLHTQINEQLARDHFMHIKTHNNIRLELIIIIIGKLLALDILDRKYIRSKMFEKCLNAFANQIVKTSRSIIAWTSSAGMDEFNQDKTSDLLHLIVLAHALKPGLPFLAQC
uniref:Uncharacterized protein n=1 Tax=Romanomermis culicivorax TaxID=13658 RepID=A0A915IZ22_ROMCU